jgi:DNA-binding response OmpR family regulator
MTLPLQAARLLIIEDEADLRDAMVDYLVLEGFQVHGVTTLSEAESWMAAHDYDILILDLGLPDGDGLAWRKTKSHLRQKGLIVTTARGGHGDRIDAAKIGADLYLVKPVSLEELAPMVHNLARRLRPVTSNWEFNSLEWTLRSPLGVFVKLTHSEATLIREVSRVPGQPVARHDLIVALGENPDVYDIRRLEIMVRRLRNKAEKTLGRALPLETVHRQGLAFTEPIHQR